MTDLTRDQLVTEAAKLGITVPKSWAKPRIETAIVEARRKLDTPAQMSADPTEFSATSSGLGQVATSDDEPDEITDEPPLPTVDMHRFIAEDKASHLGIIFGPEWTTEQLELAIATMTEALAVEPPPATDGWDTYENGTHSPRG